MALLTLILLILGFVCFLVTAFGWVASTRVNLVALGLALWIFVVILEKWPV